MIGSQGLHGAFSLVCRRFSKTGTKRGLYIKKDEEWINEYGAKIRGK